MMSQQMDDQISGAQSENERLLELIAELERRNAMLSAELNNIANAKRFDKECFDDDRSFADWAQSRARHTLSASSADTESWLQAEMLKRLKSEGYFMKHNGYWTKIADECAGMDNLGEVAELYRLPSPLATPEERIKEGRI